MEAAIALDEELLELLLSDPAVAAWLEPDEDDAPGRFVAYDEGAGG